MNWRCMRIEFITSDLHLGHEGIQGPEGFCKETRGNFTSIEEMDEYLIEAHNSVVTENDVTYHLGDFSIDFTREKTLEKLIEMNGQIHFIKGNHDGRRIINYLEKNTPIMPNGKPKIIVHDVGLIVKNNKRSYYLTHYPLQLGGRRGLRSLCGHIHEQYAQFPYALNVGVDSPELPDGHTFGVPLTLDKACELSEAKFERYLKGITNPEFND